MVSPPGDPRTSASLPLWVTMVGVIELAMRLPGASALGPMMEKAPMALARRTPVPGMTTLEPKAAEWVYVHETALPAASTTEKCVVCGDSAGSSAVAEARVLDGVA